MWECLFILMFCASCLCNTSYCSFCIIHHLFSINKCVSLTIISSLCTFLAAWWTHKRTRTQNPLRSFPTCVCPQERNMVMTSSILPSVGLACSAFCVEHDHGSVNGMQEYLYHDLGDLKKVKSTITFIL